MRSSVLRSSFFFFHRTTPTEIYTLSLHDALPIFQQTYKHSVPRFFVPEHGTMFTLALVRKHSAMLRNRSEERFSRNAETDLVCRLLLEKKKTDRRTPRDTILQHHRQRDGADRIQG